MSHHVRKRGRVAILPMNGYTMAYDTAGNGVPLVFIHQVATDRRLWHHQRSIFYRRYRLITVDIMGHGQVSWPSKEFSLERTAAHVQTLLEAVKGRSGILDRCIHGSRHSDENCP
jgi:pimeloyl-ACP methyl ester carboxylesterase